MVTFSSSVFFAEGPHPERLQKLKTAARIQIYFFLTKDMPPFLLQLPLFLLRKKRLRSLFLRSGVFSYLAFRIYMCILPEFSVDFFYFLWGTGFGAIQQCDIGAFLQGIHQATFVHGHGASKGYTGTRCYIRKSFFDCFFAGFTVASLIAALLNVF